MNRPPDFSPDNIELTLRETIELCIPAERKWFGDLLVASNEAVPATGVDTQAGEPRTILEQGNTNQLMMHITYVEGADQVRRDIAQAASYIALHEHLRSREYVVGVTHQQIARMAMRGLGFRVAEPHDIDDKYLSTLREAYETLRVSDRQPLRPAMVYMPVGEMIDRFAIRRLGRDPLPVLTMAASKAAKGDGFASDDPLLPILRQIISSMQDNPEA